MAQQRTERAGDLVDASIEPLFDQGDTRYLAISGALLFAFLVVTLWVAAVLGIAVRLFNWLAWA